MKAKDYAEYGNLYRFRPYPGGEFLLYSELTEEQREWDIVSYARNSMPGGKKARTIYIASPEQIERDELEIIPEWEIGEGLSTIPQFSGLNQRKFDEFCRRGKKRS